MRQQIVLHQFSHDGGNTTCAVVILRQILANRLQVHEMRHLVADILPVLIVQLHPKMARNRVQVDRRVGRAADGGVHDDGVFKRLTRHDLAWAHILPHHIDDPLAGPVGHLAPFTIRRGDGG